jgi:hypothetical protein
MNASAAARYNAGKNETMEAAYAFLGPDRDKSDCHFRKTATEYDRKPGIQRLSCTAR